MKTLFLLVDCQEGFLSDPHLSPHRNVVEAKGARILQHCRESGFAVAHVHMSVDPTVDDRMAHWKESGRLTCEVGSKSAEPSSLLKPLPQEPVFYKSVFSAFIEPELLTFLRDAAIDVVWIAGIHTHTCIRQTALDAYQHGFEVVLCADVLGSNEPALAAQSLLYLEDRGVALQRSEDMLTGQSRVLSQRALAERVAGQISAVINTPSEAFDRMGAIERLQAVAIVLSREAERFATLIVDETRKPIRMAREEVKRSIDLLNTVADRISAEDAIEVHAEGMIRYLPRGLVALLTPWNNPLAIPIGQLAPALVYGNRVVWKPSPHGVRVARALAVLLAESGVGTDQLALVEGGADVGLLVAGHPAVNAVSFTGSCAAGDLLAARCHQLGREFQAEMGGNNGVIVWGQTLQGAETCRQIAHAAFGFSGQRCTAVRRLIVPESDLEAGLPCLLAAVASLPYGDPLSEETLVGPLCSTEKARRLEELVERARPQMRLIEQPHLCVEGAVSTGQDYFPPTILICDDPTHEIVQEESFGPVLVIEPVPDFDQALERLNGVRFGLTAGLVGGDGLCRSLFLAHAQAGILNLDSIHAGAGLDMPFGGWKASAMGPPQHGAANRNFYTKPQAIYET
ncbi:MAG: aldehyde dehydrogenase family protein [Opitutae bacterium]|nr:aldehyde dehydrogenase family protein [Opitutae bacterium]MDG1300645.1 aldehyde dehydrogenase family protein [Opitutae bacterium]